MTAADDRLDDLQRALAIYAEHADASPEEVSALLEAHSDLRDLLAPMWADARTLSDDATVTSSVNGRTIGDYRLVREIGRGGMGVVYEAIELSLDRTVALKVLPTHRGDNPEAIVRLRREATAAAGLDHKGIVKVHASGTDGDVHFIAMDFVVGAPLSEIIRELKDHPTDHPELSSLETAIGSLAQISRMGTAREAQPVEAPALQGSYIATVVGFVAQLADALAHAHARGVIHRDVKPANIMIRRDGSVVLTDFGIARRDSQPSLTRTGDIPGTPYYVAPEQVQSWRHEVDHRADIFSLGVTLYEILTVQRPFEGRTSQQVMNRIVSSEPVHPRRLNSELPSDLAAIVLMALEKDPARRYQSATEFAADLRAFLAYRPIKARPPSVARRLRSWSRREPLKATFVALVVLAVPTLAGLGGYWSAIQPTLRAGEQTLQRQRVEGELTKGFLMLKEIGGRSLRGAASAADRARTRDAFEAALDLDRQSVEAIAGLLLTARREGPAAVTAELARHATRIESSAPLRRLRAYVPGWSGKHDAAKALKAELGEIDGALDAFVAGISELQSVHQGEPGAAERAARYLDLCVLSAESPRPLYHFERAHAIGHLPSSDRAEAAADVIEALWPDMVEARFWAAFALVNTNPKRAAVTIRKAIDAAPDRWLFWNNLGFYLQSAGDQAGARDAYEKSLALHPDNPGLERDLGVVYRRLGDVEKSEAAYHRSLAMNPRNLDVWVQLADEQLAKRRLADAEKSVAGAMKHFPRAPSTQRILGELHLAKGDLPKAIKALRRAQVGEPTLRGAFHLGRALSKSGDRKGALASYRDAVRLRPGDASSHANLGNLLRKMKDLHSAEHHLRTAIRLNPTLPEPYHPLFGLLRDQNRKKELHAHCAMWREKRPDDGYAWAKSAHAALWHGPAHPRDCASTAMPFARRARELSRDLNPAILLDVGYVEFYAGQPEAALATMRKGLDVAVKNKWSKRGYQDPIRGGIVWLEKMIASGKKKK